nr:MazG nucleotide pyrophosphohydrolase domain-containing protein [Salipaludibacillus neizhouensis]
MQRHSHGTWLPILVEELGEVAEAMQQGMMSEKNTDADNLYDELIQTAAVAERNQIQLLLRRMISIGSRS